MSQGKETTKQSSAPNTGAETTGAAVAAERELPEPMIHTFGEIEHLAAISESRLALPSKTSRRLKTLLRQKLKDSKANILSFDVFDTFLLRNNKPEALRFWELSAELAAALGCGYTANDLYLARCLGMEFSYRTRPAVEGCREGRIEEVIRTALCNLGLPQSLENFFLEKEKEYEARNLYANKLLLDLLRSFKKTGGKVILISDMYLGADHIRDIVKSVAGLTDFDGVFSSADEIVSKRSGGLYRKVQEIFDAEPEEFFHIGDSLAADMRAACSAGWSCLHFPISDAELSARTKSLNEFIQTMDRDGLDVRRWAKI